MIEFSLGNTLAGSKVILWWLSLMFILPFYNFKSKGARSWCPGLGDILDRTDLLGLDFLRTKPRPRCSRDQLSRFWSFQFKGMYILCLTPGFIGCALALFLVGQLSLPSISNYDFITPKGSVRSYYLPSATCNNFKSYTQNII